ncbi:hypothetical protein N7474_005077 [Penicillium riverlandense]|uniref:uncharacterized protein n=1 Tax=Penicillium riverlandense TaxID=1903569 RepID=UPI002546970B|nr:uncharacterized protein N7474_005077 [Penicillium riverlandense]KAJ5819486.1 hypothetical protein N7474_005077 [Penicillium riverlandense]
MGMFTRVVMPWWGPAKKNRVRQQFFLKVSPGVPQSSKDKEIFNPDWSIKPEWDYEKEGNRLVFIDKSNSGRRYTEDDLASCRQDQFTTMV